MFYNIFAIFRVMYRSELSGEIGPFERFSMGRKGAFVFGLVDYEIHSDLGIERLIMPVPPSELDIGSPY